MVYAKARNIGKKKNKPKKKTIDEELQEKAYKWFPDTKYKYLNKFIAFWRKLFLLGERHGTKLYDKLNNHKK